jgi:hypothetical protein
MSRRDILSVATQEKDEQRSIGTPCALNLNSKETIFIVGSNEYCLMSCRNFWSVNYPIRGQRLIKRLFFIHIILNSTLSMSRRDILSVATQEKDEQRFIGTPCALNHYHQRGNTIGRFTSLYMVTCSR